VKLAGFKVQRILGVLFNGDFERAVLQVLVVKGYVNVMKASDLRLIGEQMSSLCLTASRRV